MVEGTAVEGVVWDVVAVVHYKNGRRMGDGDTMRLIRTGVFKLGDKPWRLTDPGALGEPIRLPWVDTPEAKDKAGNAKASAEVSSWLERKLALGPLRVVCFDSAGWDRILGDVVAVDGESCAQWLLTHGDGGVGWPLYVRGQ